MRKTLLFLGMCLLFMGTGYGQTTIYSEDFTGDDGYGAIGPGNTVNVSGVDWTVDVTNSSLTATSDFFQVVSGVFQAQDVDGTQVSNGAGSGPIWESPSISIAGYTNVSISLDVSNNAGGFESEDFIKAYYVIDSGSEVTFGHLWDDNGDPTNLADSTFSVSGLSGSTLQVFVEIDNNAGGEMITFDNVKVTGTSSGSSPTKLSVTQVNGGSSPSVSTPFDVEVQLLDGSDNPISATQDTSITLSLATGSGSLGGTLTGTVTSGNSTVTISGVTYDTAESGVQITATNTGGSLTSGTSSTFDVLAAADQLVLVSAPTTGTTDVTIDQFTVEARRSGDSSVDLNYTKSVTISKASGTGNLSGTTSVSASAGVATFNNLSFDAAGDFTIEASDGSLTSSASSTITIADPEPVGMILTGVIDGPLTGGLPKAIELFVTNDISDLSDYSLGSASNGGGSAGEEYTFPSVSVSAGTFIYVSSESTEFSNFFGFSPTYTSGVANINGDDAIELFQNSVVVDVYGDVNVDGSGESWDHLDGWGYRKIGTSAATTFNASDWSYSGINALDGETTNASATTPFPSKTYTNGWFVHLSGSTGYRLLSAPTTATISSLLDPIWTQGASTGADATNGDPNVFTWPTTAIDGTSSNWSGMTDLSGTLGAGTGILVYVFADDDYNGSDDAFPKTLSVSGTENAADVAPTVNSNANGWTLVGNPFASTIDFDVATKSELTDVAYVWDANASSWKDWNGTSGDLTDGLITPFQGFFIQNSGTVTSPSITFTSGSKTTGGSFYGKENPESPVTLRLEMKGTETSNSVWLQFSEAGAFDAAVKGDAVELQALSAEYSRLAVEKSGDLLNIAHLPLNESFNLPLDVSSTESGEFTLKATDFDLPAGMSVVFHDYQTGFEQEITEDFEYKFELGSEVAAKAVKPGNLVAGPLMAKSSGSDRFGIAIQPTGTSTENTDAPAEFALEQNYPNPFNPSTTIQYSVAEPGLVSLSVYNLMGQRVAELVNETKSAGTFNVSWNASNAASGMYYYRLVAGGKTITRKMTLIK